MKHPHERSIKDEARWIAQIKIPHSHHGKSRLIEWRGWKGFSMKTAAEYRAMADECFQWAREATDGAVRAGYLGLARVWLDAAAKLDGLPASRMASTTEEQQKKLS